MPVQNCSSRVRYRWLIPFVICLTFLMLASGVPHSAAQTPEDPQPDASPSPEESEPDGPPFSLPFADLPGLNTWLYEQHFGNTIEAYDYGRDWYASGEQLHFGVDFEAPCGTTVLAIADGVVTNVDAESFGAGPHNVTIRHTGTGYTSIYGHLLEYAPVRPGQQVQRGEPIGLSGDPDGTCGSRPHLHLEVRNDDYTVSYNPLPFFEVNWHMLASIGPIFNAFEQDLDHPYRWMKLEEQPDVTLGGNPLNNYASPWPPKREVRAPDSPPADRQLEALPEDVTISIEPVSTDAWNLNFWWDAADLDAVYVFDQIQGEGTGVFRQPLDGSARSFEGKIPAAVPSPNGDVTVQHLGAGNFEVVRRTDGARWDWPIGNYPAVSPDGTRLLWTVAYGEFLPGTQPPGIEVWISNLDGTLQRMVYRQSGGWAMWLDAHRLLIGRPVTYMADTQLYILDVDSSALTPEPLGTFAFLRGVSVAPGGGWIAFYLPFQEDPAASGMYVLETQPGAQARKLDAFGSYQWRDDDSLYFLSYGGDESVHRLYVMELSDGIPRPLTDPDEQPIRVANGEWQVSPDGTRIAYVDPEDYGLYVITVGGD